MSFTLHIMEKFHNGQGMYWWVTIVWWVGDILGMIGDPPWQLSPGVSFVSKVKVPIPCKYYTYFQCVTILRLVGDHPWDGDDPLRDGR